MFATIPSVIAHIKAGQAARARGHAARKRSRSLPDVPTVAEKGFPGFEAGSWFGFFAPKGTPPAVIAQSQQGGQRGPAVARGADDRAKAPTRSAAAPQQFGKFAQQEYEKWRTIVRESGATVD